MSLGLELTDDEMARVMEMREKWSDEEHQRRHYQKNDETNFDKPTNFIF